MNSRQAFEMINNLHVREPLRKYQPQWSTVAISRQGEIIDVIKHKERPDLKLNKQHLMRYPTSVQFTAWAGRFSNIKDLEKTVKESAELGKRY